MAARPAADRAGDAIARTPGRLLAFWQGLAPHQRGVAGAVAGLVLLVVVAGLAVGVTLLVTSLTRRADRLLGVSRGDDVGVFPGDDGF